VAAAALAGAAEGVVYSTAWLASGAPLSSVTAPSSADFRSNAVNGVFIVTRFSVIIFIGATRSQLEKTPLLPRKIFFLVIPSLFMKPLPAKAGLAVCTARKSTINHPNFIGLTEIEILPSTEIGNIFGFLRQKSVFVKWRRLSAGVCGGSRGVCAK
jgi:hypothetical protein